MGVRGEVFSTRVRSRNDRRTYFLNVKENRNRDLFVTIVESKKGEGAVEFERHQIVVFEDDIDEFRKGLEQVVAFVEERKRTAHRKTIRVRRPPDSAGPPPDGPRRRYPDENRGPDRGSPRG